MPRTLMDTKAAGQYLGGIPASTMTRWRMEGRGPAFHRIVGHIRYDQAELDAWLDAQRCRSTADEGQPLEAA